MLALEQDLQQKMQHLALLQQHNEHLKAKTHTLQLALASSELTLATVQNVQAAASLPAAASALASAATYLPHTTTTALQQQQHTPASASSPRSAHQDQQQDQQQEQGSAAATVVPPLSSSGTSSSLQLPQQVKQHMEQLLQPLVWPRPSRLPHSTAAAPGGTEAGTAALHQNHSGLYTIDAAAAAASPPAAAASFQEARLRYQAMVARLGQLLVAYDSAAPAGEGDVNSIPCSRSCCAQIGSSAIHGKLGFC
jgi:hypothetical protein